MHDEEVQYDIKVVNAYKSFGDTNIINGLYMKVRSGSIYGFLGASGCGKSTILQCILGKFSLDSGTIELKADNLKDIGYMPQNLSLENALTIKEIFEYYGALYRMTKEQIDRRINHLDTVLQLPDLGQYIKNISGGQGRRVSLAISILHEPKIIMLDEPTVGLDSLLRENIWEEFSRMVKQSKKTFIITTHYIEEAAKANCVGLMRNGVLIEEGPPQDILMKYETDSLESAFLILCCKQENIMTNKNSIRDIQNNEIVHKQSIILRKSVKIIDFMRIIALLKKNTRMFSRDYLLLMITAFLPIIQSVILCLGVGVNIKGLTISVKNDEVQLSDCLHFNANGCILDEASNQTMSCVVMNYLSSVDYKLVEVNDRDTSETIMRDQNSLAFLYFPKEYTKNLKDYIGDNYANYDFQSLMHVNIDKSNLILKNQIVDDVIKSVKHVIKESLQACSKNPRSVNVPINFNLVFGKEVKSFLNYQAALYVATTGFYLSSIFSVSLMLLEKMNGLLERSMFAGVTIIDLLISLFCINIVIYVIQMVITLFIVYIWFPNPPPAPENCFIFFTIVLLIGLIGFFYGILLAGLFPTELGAVYGTSAIFWTQFMLSGFEWPVEGQIYWMRPMSKLLPMSIAGIALNDITLKGWAWDHPSVMYSSSLLIVHLFLIVMVLYGLGKIKKDMWILNK